MHLSNLIVSYETAKKASVHKTIRVEFSKSSGAYAVFSKAPDGLLLPNFLLVMEAPEGLVIKAKLTKII